MDISGFKVKAAASREINARFLRKLKKTNPSKLDNAIHAIHEEVFEDIDCLSCANCCKTTSPIFYQKDIERLSKRFRIRPSEFIEKYLHIDEDKDYVLNFAPCPFLDNDNFCLVYEDRPNACKEYPHTDRKRFYQLLELTIKNTEVCPAVLSIVEKLRNIY